MNSADIKAITEKFGPPGYENDRHKFSKLNEPFWAAYYAAQCAKLIFEPEEREFYDYDDETGIFVPKSSDRIRTELSEMVMAGAKNWDGFSAMQQFRSDRHLSGIVAHLRGQVEERDFFKSSHYVHLGNCTLKFKPDGSSFTIENFSPQHRSRNRSPINYAPDATCPKFEKKILGHIPEEDRELIKKYSGQCLLGRNLTQRFLILDGEAGASKGALVLILSGIVGPENVYELRTRLLSERFEIGRMLRRTLLVGSDVKGNFLSEDGAYRIKSLVGGDHLAAERKGSNSDFYVYGTFNIILTSNVRLRMRLDEDRKAWERRTMIVRYDKPYEGERIFEIDKRLLETEAAGILNWCIDGLKLLFQDYATNNDIILSQNQITRVSDLLSESDSLRLFVSNEIVRDTGQRPNKESYSLTVDEIIAEYIDDCVNSKNWIPVPYSVAEKRLPDLMIRYFGITKSHGIPRGDKLKRGFWNVRFSESYLNT